MEWIFTDETDDNLGGMCSMKNKMTGLKFAIDDSKWDVAEAYRYQIGKLFSIVFHRTVTWCSTN